MGGMGGTEGKSHHQEHEQSWETGQKSLERKLLHGDISMEQGIPGGTCSLREKQPLKSGDSQCETGWRVLDEFSFNQGILSCQK